MCDTCGESINSSHINLTKGADEVLHKMREENELWGSYFCRECLFYSDHDINNPEQEDYDEDLIYENRGFGSTRHIVIVGKKPIPDFPHIYGPFYIFREDSNLDPKDFHEE